MRAVTRFVPSLLLIAGCTPPLSFDGRDGFENLAGEEAQLRLKECWPASVDGIEVRAMSYRAEFSRDSSSTWYRILLDADAAERWALHAHTETEQYSLSLVGKTHGIAAVEGVHREIAGPPSLRDQTGVTPAWWSPPKMDYRATEAMLWYSDSNSGVARAAYSAFDASAGVLWIYLYTCQHDTMWARANVPAGEHFGVDAQAEISRHREENDENRSTPR